MKVKRYSVCQPCRLRKIGCDGKNPECSQCLLTGRQCPGYPIEWSFVDQSRSEPMGGRRSRSRVENRKQHAEEFPRDAPLTGTSHPELSNELYPPRPTSTDDISFAKLVNLIIRSYMPEEELRLSSDISHDISHELAPRLCGSWVEVLLDFDDSTRSDVVSTASAALGTLIMSQSLPKDVPSIDSTRSYLTAIQMMQRALSSANIYSDRELLVSIMCLSLAELMFSGSYEGLAAHANAVARILQAHGPERYQTGILHRLFIGFRPLLMIKAIQDRKSSFLHSMDWIKMPFAILEPSAMQSLLSQAASIPTLLRRMDEIYDSQVIIDKVCIATQLFGDFDDILHSLDEWEASILSSENRPVYWYQDQETGTCEVPTTRVPCIWFPGITMANALTSVWSFRIICFFELERLAITFPQLNLEYSKELSEFDGRGLLDNARTLTTRVCQSIDYLLQDKMKLFGPASTILPLQLVYAVAELYPHGYQIELGIVRKAIDRLVFKGLRSFPSYVFERNPFLHRWDILSNKYSSSECPREEV
ncbi:conserved hypothetical protein [Paecilomyces variotii No. 5]|uniref:Zn(2)-C6 fungal-type domain-containing protein n=1 Tax=Byssochlamys spectabilis (strain No. 5 / NBRC 109023) TaxID=1356009 RepID=V5HWV2_BYSSN|nr:conserved hypothetical protein [Paecilomyces variotii No. 5]